MIRSDNPSPRGGRVRPVLNSRQLLLPIGLLVFLAGCAEANPQSVFAPVSPNAAAVTSLFWTIIGIAAVIFIVVEGALFYALIQFRVRPGRTPADFTGNPRLEVIWTAIPALILAVVFFLTARTVFAIRPPGGDPVEINVTAHQWWWEFEYPGDRFFTANELHVPVGETVVVHLTSGDVVHSFWAPTLSPKWDAVPGQMRTLWFDAQRPGLYQGNCSEFCGIDHAWMYFPVQADNPADYQAWVRAQQQPAATPTGLALRGQQIYQSQTCGNCHAITGLESNARVGPNLTHVGSRLYLGGGVLTNTPRDMHRWLENPQGFKPGSTMPNYRLAPDELDALTAYMESLR